MAGVTEELNFRFNFNGLLWLLAVSEILGTCASFSFLTVAGDVPFACTFCLSHSEELPEERVLSI